MTDGGISVSSQIGNHSGHKEFWRLHIQAWQDSGLSQRAYCKKNNLSEYRFSKWKSRLVNDSDAGRFVRVPLTAHLLAPIKCGVLHVYAPNGFRVDIDEEFDSGYLTSIIFGTYAKLGREHYLPRLLLRTHIASYNLPLGRLEADLV